jgi:phosphatidylglycerophosphatase A
MDSAGAGQGAAALQAGAAGSSPLLKSWERPLLWIATGLGFGYAPIASGTFGSLWGPPLVWGLTELGWTERWLLVPAAVMALIGGPICAIGVRRFGDKDPSEVVYDEIAAFPIALALVPFNLATAFASFFVFRLFDIVKPWPCRRLEHLPGGWGVLLDDLMAGVYTAIALWAAWEAYTSLAPGWQ